MLYVINLSSVLLFCIFLRCDTFHQASRPYKYSRPSLVLQGVESSPQQRHLHRILLHPLHLPRHLPDDWTPGANCLPRWCYAWGFHHFLQVIQNADDPFDLLLKDKPLPAWEMLAQHFFFGAWKAQVLKYAVSRKDISHFGITTTSSWIFSS